jgi:hypothetical protein
LCEVSEKAPENLNFGEQKIRIPTRAAHKKGGGREKEKGGKEREKEERRTRKGEKVVVCAPRRCVLRS